MEFKDRLKKARALRKMGQVKLSEITGLDQTTISNLETGKTSSTTKVVEIAHALQVSPRWLATGQGEMERKSAPEGNAELVGVEITETDEALRPDEVMLPVFRECEFAAGDGSSQVVENHGLTQRFSLDKLTARNVSPDNAALAVAKGSSMEPTINDGGLIGIDKGARVIEDGKIFALDHGGELRVKRLYKMPLSRMRLTSDNAAEYPDEVYSLDDPDAPRIIGKVFYRENFE